MGSPNSVNPIATFMNNVVAAIVKGGRLAGEAYVLSLAPWLANPFIKWFLDYYLDWMTGLVDHSSEMFIDGLIIEIQTNGEKSEVYQKLSAIIAAKGAPDAKTIQDAKSAWADAIHFDGIANSHIVN